MRILRVIGLGMIAVGTVACSLILIAAIKGSSLFDTAESAVTFWSLFAAGFIGGIILCGIDSDPEAARFLRVAVVVLLLSALIAIAFILFGTVGMIHIAHVGALWALFILGMPAGAAVALLVHAKEADQEVGAKMDREES